MAEPHALGPFFAAAARQAISRALPAGLLACLTGYLTGCASLAPTTPVDPTTLRDRSIEVVVKPPPSFYADNRDRRRFGIVGVLIMAHEGNRQVKEYNLIDPAIALGAALEKAIERAEARARRAAAQAPVIAPDNAAAAGPAAARRTASASYASAAAGASPATGASASMMTPTATGTITPMGSGTIISLAATAGTAAARPRRAAATAPVPPPVIEPGNPGASGTDLTLFVQTTNWEYRPFQGQRDQFYVIYSARVDLVDNRSGRLLARDRCEVTPTVDARLTEDELLADEARRLRIELAATSRLCLAMLRSHTIANLLALNPPIARR